MTVHPATKAKSSQLRSYAGYWGKNEGFEDGTLFASQKKFEGDNDHSSTVMF